MATRLLIASGTVILPLEYTFFYPLQEVAQMMDRFIPSSKQPQHWSRNYNGSQEEQKRSNARHKGSPENLGVGTYRQGVTLRAEDLLGEQRLAPVDYLSQGDRRSALGGSATELTKCERQKAPHRRSSEGNYNLRRQSSSSSSSNAADDPTSSSNTSSNSSSSSSSESSCNGDTEACNYCRLTESSDDERSSSSSRDNNNRRRRLTRALSEDCNPPSKGRPLRRTSPGEYLRHKRDQMEKLRNERLNSPLHKLGVNFQRCDSDPRLNTRHFETQNLSTFVSPTKNRIRQSTRQRSSSEEHINQVVPVSQLRTKSSKTTPKSKEETSSLRRQKIGKGVVERRSRSKERKRLIWNCAEEVNPFMTATFTCSVCDCNIPFVNCILCNTSASQECEFLVQNGESTVCDAPNLPDDQTAENKKELEEFYDGPTPVNSPNPDERRSNWTSNSAIHKSFNLEDMSGQRRRSVQLRKHNSEPVPEKEEGQRNTRSQSDPTTHPRSESSCSSSGKRNGFHVAKESPKKVTTDEESSHSSCQTSETTMDEGRVLSPDVVVEDKNRKSPVFLKPEFVFEPEIIHKANPLIDEAETDVLPSARDAFRRLSTEEYLSTVSIHEAAAKGDLHVVKLLTKKDSKQMETVDERGWTPIHLAAAHGHSEVVKYLAAEGAHLSALDPSSYTALHLSAMNGHYSCLEVLLPMGVDVDSVTAEGFTALHLAVMNVHLECIQLLLQWGSSLEKRDALGRGVYEMVEEYNLEEVANVLRKFHKQLHKFKHVLDFMKHRKDRGNPSDIPQEFMDILASIAEESGTE